MIALALLSLQSARLWPDTTPLLLLDYRMEVRGEADIELDERLLYRVNRSYQGSISLDIREGGGAWDFNFDSTQKDPRLIQTTAANISIHDEMLKQGAVVRSWTADLTARRVMTEATVTLNAKRMDYDLEFGIGDTLGATDAVSTFSTDPGAGTKTVSLTQIPNFRTAKDEFRSCTVRLPRLGRAEFTKSWPVAQTLMGRLKNRTLKVVVWVKISAVWAQTAD